MVKKMKKVNSVEIIDSCYQFIDLLTSLFDPKSFHLIQNSVNFNLEGIDTVYIL